MLCSFANSHSLFPFSLSQSPSLFLKLKYDHRIFGWLGIAWVRRRSSYFTCIYVLFTTYKNYIISIFSDRHILLPVFTKCMVCLPTPNIALLVVSNPPIQSNIRNTKYKLRPSVIKLFYLELHPSLTVCSSKKRRRKGKNSTLARIFFLIRKTQETRQKGLQSNSGPMCAFVFVCWHCGEAMQTGHPLIELQWWVVNSAGPL